MDTTTFEQIAELTQTLSIAHLRADLTRDVYGMDVDDMDDDDVRDFAVDWYGALEGAQLKAKLRDLRKLTTRKKRSGIPSRWVG